jgi:hypothetical protein
MRSLYTRLAPPRGSVHDPCGSAEAKPERTLTPAQLDLLEDCTPLYALLRRHALTPLADPPVALPCLAGAFAAVGSSPNDGSTTGAHLHIPDQRNRRTLVGIRDGVSGRFSIVPRAEAKVRGALRGN